MPVMRLAVYGVLVLFFAVATVRPADAGYASIVIDAQSGHVLSAVNENEENYPASLTKMMTLYLVFDALDAGKLTLTQALPVSTRAASRPPTRIGVKPGQTIRVRDAILALTTKSANDVAVVLAEAVGGTEEAFARQMTRKAHQLGMTHTVFKNASGLPDARQVTTARDLARLSQALILNHQDRYHFFSARSFTWHGRTYRTHNHLLSQYDGADGIKTGYIRASGYNLAASAVRAGRRLIAVVMGGKTARKRDRQMAALLDTAFDGVAVARATWPDRPPVTPVAMSGRAVSHAVRTRTAAAEVVGRGTAVVPPTRVIQASSTTATLSGDQVRLVGDRSWAIQVGVFSNPSSAEMIAQKAASLLRDLPDAATVGVTTKARPNQGPLYRARIIGVSRDAALEACQELVRRDMECWPVNADEPAA